jgi:hypothetical protein
VAEGGQALEGVEDATVLQDAWVADELLELFAAEDGVGAEGGILVDLLGQHPRGENAGRGQDELVGHRVPEHGRQGGVDVPDGPGRERAGLAHVKHQVAQVARPDLVQAHAADGGQGMQLETGLVVGG